MAREFGIKERRLAEALQGRCDVRKDIGRFFVYLVNIDRGDVRFVLGC